MVIQPFCLCCDATKESERDSGRLEETEDEQIADAVATELEKNTDTIVDERLLSLLDKAVSRAMDKYEDKALKDGSLLINVNDLATGASSKAKVQVPQRQQSSENTKTLDPETRAQDLNDQLFTALRARLERGISRSMLNAVARALVYPGCRGEGLGAAENSYGEANGDDLDVPCDVVRWIRKHWFEESVAENAYRDGLTGIGREEL